MKNKTNAIKLIIAILASNFIVSCASSHTQESAGQFVDSSVITTKVKSKLMADKQVKSLPITVKTYKNTVQLSGFVDTPRQKYRAEQIARSVEGVEDVDDALVVKKL